MSLNQLIGPFKQIVTMDNMNPSGTLKNESLKIINDGAILIIEDTIAEIGTYQTLLNKINKNEVGLDIINEDMVLIPGIIDAHTHICFAGSRAEDYSLRSNGKSYLEIARAGGGIMQTVYQTRKASLNELVDSLTARCERLLSEGITTCEVKSGYGLNVKDEIKILQAIQIVNAKHAIDLIATALPAHTCPPEFENPQKYLEMLVEELLPEILHQKLANRADIFIEDGAFSVNQGAFYLEKIKSAGLDITVHADQFSTGGSELAARYKAASADHLEASAEAEIRLLSENKIPGVLLPGASLGLGLPFAPARKMFDAGMTVAIASDWNPGSAPMGDLLIQSCLLGIYEKLSLAEILAGLTVNPAHILKLKNCGILKEGYKTDMNAFLCSDYKDIFYNQGKLKPYHVWKNGVKVK
jgi:imidazolonepropionase